MIRCRSLLLSLKFHFWKLKPVHFWFKKQIAHVFIGISIFLGQYRTGYIRKTEVLKQAIWDCTSRSGKRKLYLYRTLFHSFHDVDFFLTSFTCELTFTQKKTNFQQTSSTLIFNWHNLLKNYRNKEIIQFTKLCGHWCLKW